jgi:hypothetical protein
MIKGASFASPISKLSQSRLATDRMFPERQKHKTQLPGTKITVEANNEHTERLEGKGEE